MKYRPIFIVVIICWSVAASGQVILNRDPQISAMVNEISRDSLEDYITHLVSFKTRHTLSTQTKEGEGIGAARNYVLNKFKQFAEKSSGRFTAYIDTTTLRPDGRRVNRAVRLGNVMGVLKGTNPDDDRVLIVSGHLDSRRSDIMDSTGVAPGANDDGSGTAAVIEMARVMSAHPFEATIIFVAVSGEEQGLLGAGFLADRAKKENWNVTAMLNNDMIGSIDSDGTLIRDNTKFRVFSEGIPHYKPEKEINKIIGQGLENDGRSRQLARYIKEVGERYVDNLDIKLMYRTDRFLRGGDHLPFLRNGFTAVRLTEMYENYPHTHQDIRIENGVQYGDLIEFVDFEYLRKNSGINLSVLANLAKSPGQPQQVGMEVKELTNYTTLYWKEPLYKTPKGYYILMRETSSAMWEKKIFTTATTVTLPFSKDNYFFAVQSVSEEGNESLPVIPDPGVGESF